MNVFELRIIRREIKATYDRYIEKKDSLENLTHFFNIPIDTTRTKDYHITKIDLDLPSITLHDNKTQTTYDAIYTHTAELLNYSHHETNFISLVSQTSDYKIESLYFIGDVKPIIEKLTVNQEEYSLEFEKEFSDNPGFPLLDNVQLTIRYLQQIELDNKNVSQQLLTKVYSENSNSSFEQIYTYGNDYIPKNDSQDKYSYIVGNNVIYGISELKQKDTHTILRGICFEGLNGSLIDYFPYKMYPENYQDLHDDSTLSAMLFSGTTENTRHILEIYKNNENINIKYSKADIIKKLTLPTLNEGKISSKEIKLIISELKTNYKDEFINLVSYELTSFIRKINAKNGLSDKDDELNPKLLINIPLTEIANFVCDNKEKMFMLMSEQFENASHISSTNEIPLPHLQDSLKKCITDYENSPQKKI